jgi:DNA helicase HerA-like ATPase
MAENMIGEIITEHRERMLNLKKYYPFFRLIDTSFSQFKEGIYEALDMGYIVMAVLRFFIEENNFKEKEVTYKEYQEFFNNIIRHDFDMKLTEEESREVADYVFDKMKNEGKPFEYAYYDPVLCYYLSNHILRHMYTSSYHYAILHMSDLFNINM